MVLRGRFGGSRSGYARPDRPCIRFGRLQPWLDLWLGPI